MRLGWSDGRNEAWAFSDVDHSASFGLSINGDFWHRPGDTVGLAGALNGISRHPSRFSGGGRCGNPGRRRRAPLRRGTNRGDVLRLPDLEDGPCDAGLPVHRQPGVQSRSRPGVGHEREAALGVLMCLKEVGNMFIFETRLSRKKANWQYYCLDQARANRGTDFQAFRRRNQSTSGGIGGFKTPVCKMHVKAINEIVFA